jgi:hypothetical protein
MKDSHKQVRTILSVKHWRRFVDQIIYQLTIDDVQNVALEELDEELSFEEIKIIEELVAKRIDWYGVISDAIIELQSTSKG